MSDTATPQPVYLYVNPTMADWEPGAAVAHIARPSWQRDPGRYEVRTVSATREPVRTMAGITVVPDAAIDEVDPAGAAMLIVPGGDTWEAGEWETVAPLARAFVDAGTPVAAICGGTYVLAKAGLLDDRDHTSNALEYLRMSEYGGADRYREEKAVNDGGVITASGTDPVDFAAAIFAELDLYEPHVLEAWHGLYTTSDPRCFAVLAAA